MNIIRNSVKIFISFAMFVLISTMTVFAAKDTDIERPLRIENAGFEEPSIGSASYLQKAINEVPYWRTTAVSTNKQIELLIKNKGVHLTGETLVPREGLQSAELNPDEASTMYQYVYGAPGSVYEWGVSHRARNNVSSDGRKDTMAVFIGPKQPVAPSKEGNTKSGSDQFMKTVNWLDKQSINGLKVADLNYGDCKAFEVFTTKFASNGTFVGGDDGAFSLIQDDTHTEKWHVWIIVSDKDHWYDYGVTAAEDCALYKDGNDGYATKTVTNESYPNDTFKIKYKKPDYNYQYTVPSTDTDGTIYAYCAYKTASQDTNLDKQLTIGNFVDYARLGIKSPVRVTSTEGGVTEVTLDGASVDVTASQQFSKDTAAGNEMSLLIQPETQTANGKTYTFMGAYVNDKWKYPTDSSVFTKNDDGTYTMLYTVESGMNTIHIVFAEHPYIIHSPNGGTYYGSKNDKSDEITATGNYPYNGTPTADNEAIFDHWSIAGYDDLEVSADHTVEVKDGTTAGKYNITVRNQDGTEVITIPDTDIVVLIAHYKYPQTVNIYTYEGGKWNLSDSGGEVSIKYNNQTEPNSGASTTIYVEDNTTVTITATPYSNHSLDRIVSDNTVTTKSGFIFYSAGPSVVSVYFMTGKIKPVVSFVDEFNASVGDSYILDKNTDKQKPITHVGGVYGNTISTAFTAFWSGDENTYKYIQWVIDLPFNNTTLLKKNSLISDFKDVQVEAAAYKTDSDAVNSKFKGEIYRCTDDNQEKQLIVNFPAAIAGEGSVFSTIILDGIYSPDSTAVLHSITEVNANYEGSNILNNTNSFSVGINGAADKGKYAADENNYYNELAEEESVQDE